VTRALCITFDPYKAIVCLKGIVFHGCLKQISLWLNLKKNISTVENELVCALYSSNMTNVMVKEALGYYTQCILRSVSPFKSAWDRDYLDK